MDNNFDVLSANVVAAQDSVDAALATLEATKTELIASMKFKTGDHVHLLNKKTGELESDLYIRSITVYVDDGREVRVGMTFWKTKKDGTQSKNTQYANWEYYKMVKV